MTVLLLSATLLVQALPLAQRQRIDGLFREFDKPGSPGCALGVMRDGKLVYARGYGYANLEHSVRITADTVFDTGRFAQRLTSLAVLMLEEEGQLSLDDDVRKHLPELQDYGRRVTLRQLHEHTSGMRDYQGLFWLALRRPGDRFDADDTMRMLARQRGLNEVYPGSDPYQFSHSNYFLLGQVVKRVTGQSLAEFARSRILGPLAMAGSGFPGPHQVVPRVALRYVKKGAEFEREPVWGGVPGAEGFFTSIADLARWEENLIRPRVGSGRVLGKVQVRTRDIPGPVTDYPEWWRENSAALSRSHVDGWSVACMCNQTGAKPHWLAEGVLDVVLTRRKGGIPGAHGHGVPPDKAPLHPFVGLYYSPELDVVYRLVLNRPDHLRVDHRNGSVFRGGAKDLVADHASRLQFVRRDGEITGFHLSRWPIRDIWFDRMR